MLLLVLRDDVLPIVSVLASDLRYGSTAPNTGDHPQPRSGGVLSNHMQQDRTCLVEMIYSWSGHNIGARRSRRLL